VTIRDAILQLIIIVWLIPALAALNDRRDREPRP
jgi:hypothetical protein